ncbi:MAG: glycerate kinase [Rectinemataceae bacterium]
MKIIAIADSFKGSCSSKDTCRRIAAGLGPIFPGARIICLPVADGGEGTVDAILEGAKGRRKSVQVRGPLGDVVTASYGLLGGGRAILEMAEASGLTLVPESMRNPLEASTYGTGELIRDALDEGCAEILIGIGGSATNDGGMGMAAALGYRFLDADGRELKCGGGALSRIANIDPARADPRLEALAISVACDVSNPLTGPTGASAVFGPQKGATPEMVRELDSGLARLAAVVRRDLGIEMESLPGAGAAGGLGGGLVAFTGARLKSGIEAILDLIRFDEYLEGADLVVTGEGAIDGQTRFGKVPVGVASRARNRGVPVVALVGEIREGAESVYDLGIGAIFCIMDKAMSLDAAMAGAGPLIEAAAGRLGRALKTGMELRG